MGEVSIQKAGGICYHCMPTIEDTDFHDLIRGYIGHENADPRLHQGSVGVYLVAVTAEMAG